MIASRQGVLLFAACLLIIIATTAEAVEPGFIPVPYLDLGGCPEVKPGELLRVFDVESHAVATGKHGAVLLTVQCLPEGKARLERKTEAGTRTRFMDLNQIPKGARARLLGIALSELAIADPSLPPDPLPEAPVPQAQQVQSPPIGQKKAAGQYRMEGTGGIELLTGSLVLLYGAGVKVTGEHGPLFGWNADLLYLHGDQSTPAGSTSINVFGIGGTANLRYRLSIVDLRAGIGVRLGGAWLSSTPANPGTTGVTSFLENKQTAGFFFGPMAQLGVTVSVAQKATVGITAEGGYHAVKAAGVDPFGVMAGMGGGWFGLQLCAGGWL